MNLIIDIGNTRAKLAIFKNDELEKVVVVKTKDLHNKVKTLFKKQVFENSIVSSVAKTPKRTLNFLEKHSFCIDLSYETKIPFKNLYKTPKTLGVDRIALMAASVKKFPNKNVLVIDAGSCITYDVINAKDEYYGGVIAPGLNMKYKAMHHFTEKLPLLKPKADIELGNSTKNAMHQGVVNATVFEMEGFINNYNQKFTNLTIVLTGGDTIFLADLLKSSIFANPNFLLEGLNHILNYNLQK
jgi:type III pantothenate kinase